MNEKITMFKEPGFPVILLSSQDSFSYSLNSYSDTIKTSNKNVDYHMLSKNKVFVVGFILRDFKYIENIFFGEESCIILNHQILYMNKLFNLKVFIKEEKEIPYSIVGFSTTFSGNKNDPQASL